MAWAGKGSEVLAHATCDSCIGRVVIWHESSAFERQGNPAPRLALGRFVEQHGSCSGERVAKWWNDDTLLNTAACRTLVVATAAALCCMHG